jgi:hypothetical protein
MVSQELPLSTGFLYHRLGLSVAQVQLIVNMDSTDWCLSRQFSWEISRTHYPPECLILHQACSLMVCLQNGPKGSCVEGLFPFGSAIEQWLGNDPDLISVVKEQTQLNGCGPPCRKQVTGCLCRTYCLSLNSLLTATWSQQSLLHSVLPWCSKVLAY